jgi:probable HAF family extracellular repeat protein
MKDLGTLGGDNASATWLNDAGDVFGYVDLFNAHVCSGLTCVHHGFLWQNGLMTDLGSLGTDPSSRALSINGKGQVNGATAAVCGGNLICGFPWEHGGPAIDLNSLVQPGVDLPLSEPIYISEQGEIAGNGALPNDTTATVDVSTTTSFPQNAAAVNPRAPGHRHLNVAFASASHGVFVARTCSTTADIVSKRIRFVVGGDYEKDSHSCNCFRHSVRHSRTSYSIKRSAARTIQTH